MPFEISHSYKSAAGIKIGAWKKLLKASATGMGYQWVTLMYPRRFTARGQSIYRFKARTPKYKRRARRINSNWRPLRLTGELEQVSTHNYSVKSISRGGNIITKVSLNRGHVTKLSTAEEIVKITQKELKTLIQDMKKDIIARLELEPETSFKKGRRIKKNNIQKNIRYKGTN